MLNQPCEVGSASPGGKVRQAEPSNYPQVRSVVSHTYLLVVPVLS